MTSQSSGHEVDVDTDVRDSDRKVLPNERLAQILERRRFLGPKAYWESLVLLAHGVQPTRTRAHGRVSREQLAEIDLHWHDLRREAAVDGSPGVST